MISGPAGYSKEKMDRAPAAPTCDLRLRCGKFGELAREDAKRERRWKEEAWANVGQKGRWFKLMPGPLLYN